MEDTQLLDKPQLKTDLIKELKDIRLGFLIALGLSLMLLVVSLVIHSWLPSGPEPSEYLTDGELGWYYTSMFIFIAGSIGFCTSLSGIFILWRVLKVTKNA